MHDYNLREAEPSPDGACDLVKGAYFRSSNIEN
jgi:hypothetical protein